MCEEAFPDAVLELPHPTELGLRHGLCLLGRREEVFLQHAQSTIVAEAASGLR